MDRCGSGGLGLCPCSAAICMLSLFMAVALHCLTDPASAGTETGEFCPTCPDWSNLEGWLAQKEAYERAQQNGHPALTNSTGLSVSTAGKEKEKAYPVSSMITYAGSSMAGRIVVDVRSPEDYREGHIPGARNVFWKDLLASDSLDPIRAEIALARAGINSSDPLLIYGGSDEGPAFVFWALSYLGHKNLSLLEGGMEAALAAGIQPETAAQLQWESNYTASPVPWMMATESSLEALLNSSHVQILDARDFIEFGRCHLTKGAIPFRLLMILGYLILGLLLVRYLPKGFLSVDNEIRRSPAIKTIVGFLMLIAAFVAICLVAMTVVGLPIAFAALLLILLAWMLSGIFVAFSLGRWIGGRVKVSQSDLVLFLIGFIILNVVFLLPYVGGLVGLISLSLGFGAFLYAARHHLHGFGTVG